MAARSAGDESLAASQNDAEVRADNVSFQETLTGVPSDEPHSGDMQAPLRSVLEIVSEQLLLIDADGTISYASPASVQEYGNGVNGLQGRPLAELLHPFDQPRVAQILSDAIRSPGHQVRFTFRTQRRDGSLRWMDGVCVSQLDHPSIRAVVLSARDITESKRAEQSLRENEQRMRMMLDQLPAILYSTDHQRAERTVEQILKSTTSATGEEFCSQLVHFLTLVCDVEYAFIAKLIDGPEPEAETIAGAQRGTLLPSMRYHLKGTPCEKVIRTSLAFHVERVVDAFPRDQMLRDLQIEAYMGIPLRASDGPPLGLITLLNTKPIPDPELTRAVLEVVAARSGAEIERLQAEEKLRRSKQRMMAVITHTPNVAIQWYDADGRVVLWNQASEAMFGYAESEAVGKTLDQLIHSPEEFAEFLAQLRHISETGRAEGPAEYHFRRRNGESGTSLSSVFMIPGDDHGNWFVCMDIDITDRKRAEEARSQLEVRMLHSQKLESLGVLAGGIAHDFNNLLTSMLGYAGLALMQLPEGAPARAAVREIENAARRAADLTEQMLSYSGKGRFVVQLLRLDALVSEMAKLLRTVVSRNASVVSDLMPVTIEADATQIRQVVMNLITNASDSLDGQQGEIRIRTQKITASRELLRSPYFPEECAPGEYALVEVEDTGCGMDEDTRARLFDPFFTTKFTGRGLGLAAVLGIVRSHHGSIQVESAPDRGTLIRVLIPAASETADTTRPAVPDSKPGPVAGRVLVVEDDPSVRSFARSVLSAGGLAVETAGSGDEAVALFEKQRSEIGVVLLDLTMPGMDGPDVIRRLRAIRVEVPILVMSGYSAADVTTRLKGLEISGFLQKPFPPLALLERIRVLLKSDCAGGRIAGTRDETPAPNRR